MLSALAHVAAHRMLGDHVHLWITFVFVSNILVFSLDITKTSPQDNLRIPPTHVRAVASMYSVCVWGGGGGGGGGVGQRFPNDEKNFRIFHGIRRCLLSGK
jgi:hypothetical protein